MAYSEQHKDLFDAAVQGKLPPDFNRWELSNGYMTIAHAAAQAGTLPDNFTEWELKDSRGKPVAIDAAMKKLPDGFDRWDISTEHTNVAYIAACYGNLPPDFDKWDLPSAHGGTPAHAAAEYGYLPPDFNRWDIVEPNQGFTVAHIASMKGNLPENFDQWDLRDHEGRTVAHIATSFKSMEPSPERLYFADSTGWTVAHEAARKGVLPQGFDDWSLSNNKGFTVAHAAAEKGHLPDGFDQWEMRDSKGNTVAHAAASTAQGGLPFGFSKWGLLNDGFSDHSPYQGKKETVLEKFGRSIYSGAGDSNIAYHRNDDKNIELALRPFIEQSKIDSLSLAQKAVMAGKIKEDARNNRIPDAAAYFNDVVTQKEKIEKEFYSIKIEAKIDGRSSKPPVAVMMALKQSLPKDFESWGIKWKKDGLTVAHVAAVKYAQNKYAEGSAVLPKELSHWHAKDSRGRTVIELARAAGSSGLVEEAYAQAVANGMSADINAAKQAPEMSYKEAAQALKAGTLPADFNDWSKKNEAGWTLAHAAASIGKLPADFKDWAMEGDKPGITVAHIAMRQGMLPPSFDQWDIKDAAGKTLGELAVKHPTMGAEYRDRIQASNPLEQPRTESRSPEPQAAKPPQEAPKLETSSTGRITGGSRFGRPPETARSEPEPERRPVRSFISRGGL